MRRPCLSCNSTLLALCSSPEEHVANWRKSRVPRSSPHLARAGAFHCARKGRDADMQTHTAGRFLSKHGRRGRFPPHPRPRQSRSGHRRRSHGYAVRPRRSETMNCHYMMRWRWESSRDTWSGARGLELGANGKLIGSHRARKRSHSAQDDDRLKVCLNRRARGKNRLAC